MPEVRIKEPSWDDITVNEWHRWKSLARFMDEDTAKIMDCFDVDNGPEGNLHDNCKRCRHTHFLAEYARWNGADVKNTKWIRSLAARADLPAILCYWVPSDDINPANPNCRDIAEFKVKWVYPKHDSLTTVTPRKWAEFILRVATRHWERFCASKWSHEMHTAMRDVTEWFPHHDKLVNAMRQELGLGQLPADFFGDEIRTEDEPV